MAIVTYDNASSSRSAWDRPWLAPGIILLATLVLSLLGLELAPAQIDRLFAETGPFEIASLYLWLVLGGILLWRGWRQAPILACGAVSLLFAAREADWHKLWTADSILKTNYYQDVTAPLTEKLLAGSVAFTAIALGLYIVFAGLRLLRRGRRTLVWVQTTFLGVLLLLGTKFLDRMESVLAERFDVMVGAAAGGLITALEEGGEMFTPLIFLLATYQYARQAKH